MILAADKPNYIPTAEYFYKMARADVFVLADDILYTSGSTISRTPIKSPQGKLWLSVPVLTGGRGTQQIRDVKIDLPKNWRQKHWKAISLNYKYAPYFEYYADFFEELYREEWQNLVELSGAILQYIRKALRISNRLIYSSTLQTRSGTTEKIVDIVKVSGCQQYLAWERDRSFLNAKQFELAGIEVAYLNFQPSEYHQQYGAFIPNLSIIDLLFNHGPEAKMHLMR